MVKLKRFNLLLILIVTIIIFFQLIPIIKAEDIPDCELVITCDKIKINQGEKLKLDVYLVGAGDVEFGFLNANVNNYIRFEDFSMVLNGETFPLNKSFYDYFIIHSYIPPNIPEEGAEKIWITGGYGHSRLVFDLLTENNIPYGDHDITITYVYQDKNLDWHHASNVFTFHVNTDEEKNALFYYLIGSIILPIVLSLITYFVGFFTAYYFFIKDKNQPNFLPNNHTKKSPKVNTKKQKTKQLKDKQNKQKMEKE